MDDFDFSDLFCKFMRDMNITMSDVANKTDISYQTVNSWQKGRATPKFDQVVKLCTCYNVSPEYFCGLSTEKQFKSIQYIMEYTGLSEKTINNLHALVLMNNDSDSNIFNGLNVILSSDYFAKIIFLLHSYFEKKDAFESSYYYKDNNNIVQTGTIDLITNKNIFLLEIVKILSKIDENLNLRLSVDSFNESNEAINERVKQEKLVVTFDYHGKLPASATVKVKVDGKFKDGKKLYLYYYNEEKDQFEYIDNDIKVKDSYVEFTISHCSNYFLTGTIVQDAVNNPKNINYIIIGMIVVVLVLVAATLKQSKK